MQNMTKQDIAAKVAALSKDKVLNNVTCRLVNPERNAGYLADALHVPFLDLVVVYVLRYPIADDQEVVVTLKSSNLEHYGVTTEEIEKAAMENTKKHGFAIRPVNDALSMLVPDDDSGEFSQLPDIGLYVASNPEMRYGANILLFPEEIGKLAERLNKNLFILPSSIHEVLLIAEDEQDEEELCRMVKDVNTTSVEENEVLSDHIYYYDRTTKTVEIRNGDRIKTFRVPVK